MGEQRPGAKRAMRGFAENRMLEGGGERADREGERSPCPH